MRLKWTIYDDLQKSREGRSTALLSGRRNFGLLVCFRAQRLNVLRKFLFSSEPGDLQFRRIKSRINSRLSRLDTTSKLPLTDVFRLRFPDPSSVTNFFMKIDWKQFYFESPLVTKGKI